MIMVGTARTVKTKAAPPDIEPHAMMIAGIRTIPGPNWIIDRIMQTKARGAAEENPKAASNAQTTPA